VTTSTSSVGGRRTIGLRGPITGPRIGALRDAAAALIEPGMDLVVDMSEVTDIGTEGLAVLNDVADLARADGGSFFVRPPKADKVLFDAVAAITTSAAEMSRREHPAGRGG